MQIRRFEAETTSEALAQVREAFGPDALILGTRNVGTQKGLFGLLGKTVVEVTAAVDREASRNEPPARGAPDESWRSLQLSRALVAPLEEELRALREMIQRSANIRAEQPSLAEEVALLRRAARALAARVPEVGGDDPESRYRGAGLSQEISRELAVEARERIESGEARDEAMVETLAGRLEPRLVPPREKRRHRLVVGATGVGKTTSIAKQVARSADPDARLVTTDVHRHGGAAGLRSLSKALGMKVSTATSWESLARIAARSNTRAVVDTPGRARDDQDALFELLQMRDALGGDSEVQLVLSATTKESDLRDELSRFRCLDPQSLVVTKVDDSGELGNVVNLLLEESTPPLAWLGDGQRVPDDLHVPDPHELARQVMGGCA